MRLLKGNERRSVRVEIRYWTRYAAVHVRWVRAEPARTGALNDILSPTPYL